jgi:hypothetical protein
LLGRELRQGIARAALLKTAGALEKFLFAENLRAGQFAESGRFRTGRPDDGAVQARAGGDYFGKRDRGGRLVFHNVLRQ